MHEGSFIEIVEEKTGNKQQRSHFQDVQNTSTSVTTTVFLAVLPKDLMNNFGSQTK